jgi:hypothetical protein
MLPLLAHKHSASAKASALKQVPHVMPATVYKYHLHNLVDWHLDAAAYDNNGEYQPMLPYPLLSALKSSKAHELTKLSQTD